MLRKWSAETILWTSTAEYPTAKRTSTDQMGRRMKENKQKLEKLEERKTEQTIGMKIEIILSVLTFDISG
uniref:Transposase n=1 Tax=Steinernema glaseri TaxID=37863 RepID=A0A1I7ZFQ0_9BILA